MQLTRELKRQCLAVLQPDRSAFYIGVISSVP